MSISAHSMTASGKRNSWEWYIADLYYSHLELFQHACV